LLVVAGADGLFAPLRVCHLAVINRYRLDAAALEFVSGAMRRHWRELCPRFAGVYTIDSNMA
jgi:hypothetical protein